MIRLRAWSTYPATRRTSRNGRRNTATRNSPSSVLTIISRRPMTRLDSTREAKSTLPVKPGNPTTTSGALRNVSRLRPLLAFADLELHRIAFLQALVALGSDCAVMYKNVGTICAPDESVALGVIEPLDGAFQTFHVPPLSARLSDGGPKDVPA